MVFIKNNNLTLICFVTLFISRVCFKFILRNGVIHDKLIIDSIESILDYITKFEFKVPHFYNRISSKAYRVFCSKIVGILML